MNKLPRNDMIMHLISYFMFVFFCLCCIVYYLEFIAVGLDSYEPIYGYFFPANLHDHLIYYKNYQNLKNGHINFPGINNIGIAVVYYIYFGLLEFLGFTIIPEELSLILNLYIFLLCFISFRRIIMKLDLNIGVTFLFVFNSGFWYFAQLINKDVFTIFIFYKLIEYTMYNKKIGIFFIFVFSFFIRIQLPVIICLYLYFIYSKPTLKNFLFVYLFICLLNGFVSRYQTLFISESTLGDGFSAYVYRMNINYGIGSLLFNPIKLLQSLYSVFNSINFYYDYGIDVSKLKNIPQLFIMLLLSPWIIKSYYKYNYFMKTKAKYVMSIIPSFFLIWFFNPTINSRYIMLIIPFLTLVGLVTFKYGKKISI